MIRRIEYKGEIKVVKPEMDKIDATQQHKKELMEKAEIWKKQQGQTEIKQFIEDE